jgi:uncharacterized RDD family membrane protein YckC
LFKINGGHWRRLVVGIISLLIALVIAIPFLRVIFILVFDTEMPISLKGMLLVGVPLVVGLAFIAFIVGLASPRNRHARRGKWHPTDIIVRWRRI